MYRHPSNTNDGSSNTHATSRRLTHGIFPWFAVAFVALVCFYCLPSQASAEWSLEWITYGEDNDSEDQVLGYYDSETNELLIIVLYKDGSGAGWIVPNDNPNPVDGTTSKSDFDGLVDLAKQHGNGISEPGLAKTPLGKYLAGKGIGIGNIHNPSDDSDGGGPSRTAITGFDDPKDDLFEIGGEGSLGDAGGIDGNGGPISGQLENLGRKKGTNGDKNDGSSDGKPADGGLWGPEMPGPPELVNPNPARGSRGGFVLVPPTMTNTSSAISDTAITTKGSFAGQSAVLSRSPVGGAITSNTRRNAVNMGSLQSMGLRPMAAGMSNAGLGASPATSLLRVAN